AAAAKPGRLRALWEARAPPPPTAPAGRSAGRGRARIRRSDRDRRLGHETIDQAPLTGVTEATAMAFQHVGRPIKRLEDPKLITGSDHYVDDVRLSGALTAAFVRSPHAHALIRSIDTRAARAVPRVV